MSTRSEEIFIDMMNPNEKLVWTGQPQEVAVFRSFNPLFIPVFLVGGFPLFFSILIYVSSVFDQPGILFVLVVFIILAGVLLVNLNTTQDNGTYYALTNQRVIIISGLFYKDVKTLNLKTLPHVSLITREDGRGTITFGRPDPWDMLYAVRRLDMLGIDPQRYLVPSFEMIDNAAQVYQQIKLLQKENHSTRPALPTRLFAILLHTFWSIIKRMKL